MYMCTCYLQVHGYMVIAYVNIITRVIEPNGPLQIYATCPGTAVPSQGVQPPSTSGD